MPGELKSVGAMCCLKWTSCNCSCRSRSSEPNWVWTQGLHEILPCLLDWMLDVSLVVTYYIQTSEEKNLFQPVLLSGKKKTKYKWLKVTGWLGARYEMTSYNIHAPVPMYLSDFGDNSSMWWELIPNTLKQVDQQLLTTNNSHTSAWLSNLTQGGGVDQVH